MVHGRSPSSTVYAGWSPDLDRSEKSNVAPMFESNVPQWAADAALCGCVEATAARINRAPFLMLSIFLCRAVRYVVC